MTLKATALVLLLALMAPAECQAQRTPTERPGLRLEELVKLMEKKSVQPDSLVLALKRRALFSVDPEMILKPDSSINARIRIFRPPANVDPHMVVIPRTFGRKN